MAKDRELVTPLVAIVFAVLATGVLAGAVIWRWGDRADANATAAPLPSPEPEPEPEPEPDAGALAIPAGPTVGPSAAPPSGPPPVIGAVTATVAAADHGVAVSVETSIDVPVAIGPRQMIRIVARCHVDGEWYDGTDSIFLDQTGTGAVVHRIVIVVGGKYKLAALPDACHLGYRYRDRARAQDPVSWLARRCWNGTAVVDGACPPRPLGAGDKPALALGDVRALTLRKPLTRAATPPRYITIAALAELRRPLDGWVVRVDADCTLAGGGGATQHDTGTIYLTRLTAGVPVEVDAAVFLEATRKLTAPPETCTVAFALEDRHQLAREPLGAWCWRDDAVHPGACAP